MSAARPVVEHEPEQPDSRPQRTAHGSEALPTLARDAELPTHRRAIEPTTTRGELRTYLGIAPGTGKTYAMLRDARAKRRSGIDAVVAYWERHGRAETAAQLGELELIPTRSVAYRGASFEELDVEGVIRRRPKLALVDELAHANLPGERHAKRWQDVEKLLEHGIDVYTTLNVANLESLGRLVSRITGAPRAEPVPDAFVRSGEVILVSLEPAALRRRLSQGLVFPKERADAALSNYFQFANLAALGELTELWLDETVPDPAAIYRAAHYIAERRERKVVLVALDGSPADEWLIRYAADLAEVDHAEIRGVHVEVADAGVRRPGAQLAADRRLLEELGGTLLEVRADNVAGGLLRTAHEITGSQLIIGSPGGSRWSRLLRGFTVGRVLRMAGDLPVQVVNIGQPKIGLRHTRGAAHRERR